MVTDLIKKSLFGGFFKINYIVVFLHPLKTRLSEVVCTLWSYCSRGIVPQL